MNEQATTSTAVFPLLADPQGYQACQWDLLEYEERRVYWLKLFRTHFPRLLASYRREAVDRGEPAEETEARAANAEAEFFKYLDQLDAEPKREGRLDILEICIEREMVLRAVGIADPYRLAKLTDSEHALAVLPDLLQELDAMPTDERRVALIQGVFAGNIYDLGATETEAMFAEARVDFHAVRSKLKPRPWRFDGLDAWLKKLESGPYRSAVLFVDNAGPDVTLGMLPLARDLLSQGTRVILTANATPSLNDVTHDELVDLMARIAEFDAVIRDALAQGRLTLVTSGNDAPLIDLTRLSAGLCDAVAKADVDLVVIEGMGRAVESNLDAEFTCDVLKIAMIKDSGVAKALDAQVFDLVMQFEPVAG